MAKKLLANPFIQAVIGRAMGGYLLFVGATTRWRKVNRAAAEPFWQPGAGRAIICVWHGRFSLAQNMWSLKRNAPLTKMLISQSREGSLISHTARTVGVEVIRGSASKGRQRKGAVEALLAMSRHLEDGGVIGMTPDGPRGPRMRAKRAPVALAKLGQATMTPVAWSTSNRIVFDKSWDHFILPLPFGRGAQVWGDPIPPPPPNATDEEIEVVRLQLEAEMNRISREADELAGVVPIEPAHPKVVAVGSTEPADT